MKRVLSMVMLPVFLSISAGAAADEVTQCDVLKKNLAEGTQILDVRSFIEYKLGHVPEATLIPHTDLAERIDELDKSKPVLVYCRSGYRAGLAEKVLQEQGFEQVSLLQGHWLDWDTGLTTQNCP